MISEFTGSASEGDKSFKINIILGKELYLRGNLPAMIENSFHYFYLAFRSRLFILIDF